MDNQDSNTLIKAAIFYNSALKSEFVQIALLNSSLFEIIVSSLCDNKKNDSTGSQESLCY